MTCMLHICADPALTVCNFNDAGVWTLEDAQQRECRQFASDAVDGCGIVLLLLCCYHGH